MSESNRPDRSSHERGRIISGILLAKAAVATFSIAPFLIGAYVDRLALSAAQAGRVLSVEILALALSNAAAFLWLARVDCRAAARWLLLSLVAVNVWCSLGADYALLIVQRASAGAIEGAVLALGFGILGTSSRPERNFGLYFAISLTAGALNVRLLPLFLQTAGVSGLFLNLSLYSLIALAGTVWLPRVGPARPGGTDRNVAAPSGFAAISPTHPLLLLLLAANYVYFVGQGGAWSFLERVGRQYQLPLDHIASALSLSLIAGVAGGLAATWLDLKLGRVLPLLAAIAIAITSLIVIGALPNGLAFVVGACLFNLSNNFGHPYILGMASRIDRTGRLTVLSGALHTAGQATGPVIVGLLVAPPDYTGSLWIGLVLFVFTLLLIAPAARLGIRGRLAASADAR